MSIKKKLMMYYRGLGLFILRKIDDIPDPEDLIDCLKNVRSLRLSFSSVSSDDRWLNVLRRKSESWEHLLKSAVSRIMMSNASS